MEDILQWILISILGVLALRNTIVLKNVTKGVLDLSRDVSKDIRELYQRVK